MNNIQTQRRRKSGVDKQSISGLVLVPQWQGYVWNSFPKFSDLARNLLVGVPLRDINKGAVVVG